MEAEQKERKEKEEELSQKDLEVDEGEILEGSQFKLLVNRFDVFFVSAILVIFLAGVLALWVIAATDKTLSQTEQAAEETNIIINTNNQ